MDTTTKESEGNMIWVSWAVSICFCWSKPPKVIRTRGPARAIINSATPRASRAKIFTQLLANRSAKRRLCLLRAWTYRGTTVEVMQELNSSTGM